MRHGVPMAAHNLQSELLLVTGAVDAMVTDVQCIWPGTVKVAECFDTKVITTEANVKIPGAMHVPFEVRPPTRLPRRSCAPRLRRSLPAKARPSRFRRSGRRGWRGSRSRPSWVCSPRSIRTIRSSRHRQHRRRQHLRCVAFAGCPNPKIRTSEMTELDGQGPPGQQRPDRDHRLHGAHPGAGRHDSPDATEKYAGEGLKAVLTALGGAAGLNVPCRRSGTWARAWTTRAS